MLTEIRNINRRVFLLSGMLGLLPLNSKNSYLSKAHWMYHARVCYGFEWKHISAGFDVIRVARNTKDGLSDTHWREWLSTTDKGGSKSASVYPLAHLGYTEDELRKGYRELG